MTYLRPREEPVGERWRGFIASLESYGRGIG